MKISSKNKTSSSFEVYKQFAKDMLRNERLSNSFSIAYPDKPQIQLKATDPKLLAFYLTQYYPDPHNNVWWGKGSTEWTNVSKAVPQYVGQYQPRFPGELGFYDLRIKENMLRQIELARFFGVYGFCFYYYWFDKIRLLDVPLTQFVNDDSIDFPFSICWANESWSKRWDGGNSTPLIEQSSSALSYGMFIADVIPLFQKKNYIKVNGKPLLLIYRPFSIPSPHEVILFWRRLVKELTGMDLYLVACIRSSYKYDFYFDYQSLGFDACTEFAPDPQLPYMPDVTAKKSFVCDSFTGHVKDYESFVKNRGYFSGKRDFLYRAVAPMWDNTARRKNDSLVLDGATPDLYRRWLLDVINETKYKVAHQKLDDSLVFINAWNEWAEGAYLEPDLRWHYGYLEATKDALLAARSCSDFSYE